MLKDNFCVIGLGQAGCKMAKEFYNNGYRSFFINTSYQDLQALNVKNDFVYHIPSAYGCAKIRSRAIEYAKDYYEQMIGKLLDTHPTARIFLIHYSLGGGTGGGIANIFTGLLYGTLRSKNIEDFKIINICARPKKYESYQIQKNSIDSLEEMYNMVDKGILDQYFIINNDSREDLNSINEENALLFDRWIEGEESNNQSNTDESERIDLFSYKGNAMIFEFSSKDIEEFKSNIINEYSNSIYCTASKIPTAIGLALSVNISEKEAIDIIENTVGYYSNSHITPTESSNIIFVSGIEDKGSIKNYITKLANEKANKINSTEYDNNDEIIEEVQIDTNKHKTKESKKQQVSIDDILNFYR